MATTSDSPATARLSDARIVSVFGDLLALFAVIAVLTFQASPLLKNKYAAAVTFSSTI